MKLSIVVPIYNGEKYIKRCLNSIMKITAVEWECIIIDDGSTDESSSIIDNYMQNDSRFKCIHIKNAGVSNARNVGIENSSGRALFFIDSDDWFLDNVDSELKSAMARLGLGALTVFGHTNVYPNGRCEVYTLPSVDNLTYHDAIIELTVKNQKLNNCWGVLFDREIIERYSIKFDVRMKVAEDTCFVLEYLKYVTEIHISSDPILAYWQNENGAMHRTSASTIKDDEICFIRRKEMLQVLGIHLAHEEYSLMCNFYFSNTIGYIASEYKKRTAKSMKKLIKSYANSEYGVELISHCKSNKFSIPKQILLSAMKAKFYWACYVLMLIFEKRRLRQLKL